VYKKIGSGKYISSISDPENKIGLPVDASTLNDAKSRGSLFIRKCEDGSNIHSYADQLYEKHPNYIY
jgi:hypothetical protein